MSNNASNNTGSLILGMLGVMFVGLKLTGYIDWSWWLVTLPFWGGAVVALVIILIAGWIALKGAK